MVLTGATQHRWWKEAAVYQIYPASFVDTNKDGWGDIKGIISKLDYIKDLGIDIIWVSPIFKSPQADMGYDISDYKDIDPIYGTIEDVDRLIAEMKKRNMKLMMDLVVNHTSDQHAWFIESRSSRDNPKRDWYIWKPPRGRSSSGKPLPPNNWAQILGEGNSAWTYDEKTGEFYLSLFTPEQPDLNWENPLVRDAVHDVMHFWLKRGAAGYRMDVINLISKVQTFPDAREVLSAGHEYHPGDAFYVNGPRLHEFLHEMHDKVLAKYDTITVGEMPGVSDIHEIIRTVGSNAGELNMIFIFDIVDIDNAPGGIKFTLHPFDARDIARVCTKWQRAMLEHDGWNSVFIENHDNSRSVSRYTDDSETWRFKGAKLLALMQTTLAGTTYVYQGEELGMRNVPRSWDVEKEYKDIESVNFWKKSKRMFGKDAEKMAHAKGILARKARDHSRTPVQWSAGPNAGFTEEGATPWMRVNDDHKEINAEQQLMGKPDEQDGGMSVWHFWQRGLRRRKEHKDVFVYGDYEPVADGTDGIYAYVRTGSEGGRWLVVLNFSGKEQAWEVPAGKEVETWVAGNYGPGKIKKEGEGRVVMRPWEGVLGQCVQ